MIDQEFVLIESTGIYVDNTSTDEIIFVHGLARLVVGVRGIRATVIVPRWIMSTDGTFDTLHDWAWSRSHTPEQHQKYRHQALFSHERNVPSVKDRLPVNGKKAHGIENCLSCYLLIRWVGTWNEQFLAEVCCLETVVQNKERKPWRTQQQID